MDYALTLEKGRPPKVAIPSQRASILIHSRSNSKSYLSKGRYIRREKLRRSISVTERSENLAASTHQQNRASWSSPSSPTSSTLFEVVPFSPPPSPTEFPIHFSVDGFPSKYFVSKQNWPISVPLLVIPKPDGRLADPFTSLCLQVRRQDSDSCAIAPNSPNAAYTPLVADHKFFMAIPKSHQNDNEHKPSPLLLEITTTEDAIPKRLSSLSKKAVKRTNSTRQKGHKRGKIPVSEAPAKVLEEQVQNSQMLTDSERPPLVHTEVKKVSRPTENSLGSGSPPRPTRSVRRRKATDGNFLPLRCASPSFLQPLSEEPTAQERKKMPLVTAVASSSSKVPKPPIPLRRFSTRRRRKMEAMQNPLPAFPSQKISRSNFPFPEIDTNLTSVASAASRPMSSADFEDMNTSTPFPSSSFSEKPSNPWSQIFKRGKSPGKDEKGGFLAKMKGKPKKKEGGEEVNPENWRRAMRGKNRVVGTVNMSSAFED